MCRSWRWGGTILIILLMSAPLWAHEDTSGHFMRVRPDKSGGLGQKGEGSGGGALVIDTKYNLIWELKTEENKDDLYIWEESFAYAERLNEQRYGGRDDWRVPSAMEMSTLVDPGRVNLLGDPCLDTGYFPHNGNSFYWTTSEYPPIPSVCQYTSFCVGNQFKWDKNGKLRVRCVAGAGWDALYPSCYQGRVNNALQYRELDHGNNQKTVVDRLTGLEWEQKAWYDEEADFGQGLVVEQLLRLSRLPGDFVFEWTDALYNQEMAPSGFLDEQEGHGFFLKLLVDLPYLLLTFNAGLVGELRKAEVTGHAVLGNRSYLMLFDYEQAQEYIKLLNEMEFAGHDDWRMPTVEEIITITDWNRVPCIKKPFSPTFTWLYWTSTADPLKSCDPEASRHYFT